MSAARPSLLRGVAAFSSMTFLSRLLGLLRETVIAAVFGANAATDAFWVAFRIPNFMRRLFAEGAFSLAFVPVFAEVRARGDEAALKTFVARTAGTLGGVLLVVTALGIWGARGLVHVFAPGLAEDPARLALTADLLRITFPFLLLVSLTALAAGVLNAYSKFALAAFTPVILNLCMIAAALWLAPHLRIPISALAWAILLAGVLQLAIQLPALRKLGVLSWPRWGATHPDVRKIMRLMLPTLFGSSVAQINLLLDTVIASFLFVGSQTWLALSDRLMEFPLGVFGVALGTVILPTLARHHLSTDRAGFQRALDWGLRTALLIALPAAVALVLLAKPMIATLFQHGRYNAFDTDMATLSLTTLSCGLPAFALVKVLAPAFYARQDTRTPVRAAVVAMVVNMLLNMILVGALAWSWAAPELRHSGVLDTLAHTPGLHMALGMASALAGYLNLTQLWLALRRQGVYQAQPGWLRHLGRTFLACAVMAVVLLLGRLLLWPDWTTPPALVRLWRLLALLAAGGLTYLAVLFALGFRLRELREA